jgi:hypothetical protein
MNKSNVKIKDEEAIRLRGEKLDFIYQELRIAGTIELTDENPNDGSFTPIFKYMSQEFPLSSQRMTSKWIYVPLDREQLDKIQKNPKTGKLQLCIDSPIFEWSQNN